MDGLVCPHCLNALSGEYRCDPCAVTYPVLNGIPALYSAPLETLADWRNRWRLERQTIQSRRQNILTAQKTATPHTQERLKRQADVLGKHLDNLTGLLKPMLGADIGAARETLLGLKTRLPSHQEMTSYLDNVVRDWVWGEQENQLALDTIQGLINQPAQRILLLGCGSGRLARDLASQGHTVIALDNNPLLLFVGQAMTSGERLQFAEFPRNPVAAEDSAVWHQTEALAPQTVTWVLGDVLKPPIASAAFDVVVTHWLIDILDAPFSAIASQVNRCLASGGVWANMGSLAYDRANPVENLVVDELKPSLTQQGFALEDIQDVVTPYLASPHSRGSRQEVCSAWRARQTETRSVRTQESLPDWIVSDQTPVPTSPAFQTQAASVRIHAFILALVDGQRSIADMAQELERQNLMPKDEATAALRGFFIKVWEEAQRPV